MFNFFIINPWTFFCICYAENKDIVDCKKAVSEFLMFFIEYQKAIYMINKN